MNAQRFLYGLGSFGASLLQQTVLLWVFFFYAPPPDQGLPVRVPASLMGLALGLGRVVDALADPPVAYLSDRLRAPGGRRRPFILIGSPLLALSFVLLWTPPHSQISTANFIYLTIVLAAFYFLFTLVLNPYTALLPEITPGGRGRVNMSAWQGGLSLAGTAAAFLASSVLSSRWGFSAMGYALAPIGLLALLTAGLSVQERPVHESPPPFLPAARAVLRDRRFQIYLLGLALLWYGLSMVNLSLAFVVTVLMGLPRAAVGTVLAVAVGVTILSFPLIGRAAKRIGKPRALTSAMGIAAVIVPLIGLIGLIPGPPSRAVQGYVLVALAAPALAALFVLPNALLADIAESHGELTGHRSEGLFFAMQGLIFNGTTSLAAVTLGVILDFMGYSSDNPLGLRVMPLLAAFTVAAGALVFARYPRNAKREPQAASGRDDDT